MYIKKDGSALISSMIVLSLMSLIGCMYYKMSNYNIQLEALNYNHGDIYNMSSDEEKIIYNYMKEINTSICRNQTDGECDITEETLSNIELPTVSKSIMSYNNETHRFILKYNDKNRAERCRDIDYKINENKVILIPLYIFEEKDFQFD